MALRRAGWFPGSWKPQKQDTHRETSQSTDWHAWGGKKMEKRKAINNAYKTLQNMLEHNHRYYDNKKKEQIVFIWNNLSKNIWLNSTKSTCLAILKENTAYTVTCEWLKGFCCTGKRCFFKWCCYKSSNEGLLFCLKMSQGCKYGMLIVKCSRGTCCTSTCSFKPLSVAQWDL